MKANHILPIRLNNHQLHKLSVFFAFNSATHHLHRIGGSRLMGFLRPLYIMGRDPQAKCLLLDITIRANIVVLKRYLIMKLFLAASGLMSLAAARLDKPTIKPEIPGLDGGLFKNLKPTHSTKDQWEWGCKYHLYIQLKT